MTAWASRLFPEPLDPTTATISCPFILILRSLMTGSWIFLHPLSYWENEIIRCSTDNIVSILPISFQAPMGRPVRFPLPFPFPAQFSYAPIYLQLPYMGFTAIHTPHPVPSPPVQLRQPSHAGPATPDSLHMRLIGVDHRHQGITDKMEQHHHQYQQTSGKQGQPPFSHGQILHAL